MNPFTPGAGQSSATLLGLIFGLAVGAAAAFGGFSAFVVVVVFGALGLLVGRYLEGGLHLSDFGIGGIGRDRVDR